MLIHPSIIFFHSCFPWNIPLLFPYTQVFLLTVPTRWKISEVVDKLGTATPPLPCLLCYDSICVVRPLHAPQHMPTNKTHKNTQTKRHPSPQLAHDITTRRPSWELGLLFLLPDNLSAHLFQSNDTALCPSTYITLAGCHTKKTVSRLIPGLCFTLNFLPIFTVKTKSNIRYRKLHKRR